MHAEANALPLLCDEATVDYIGRKMQFTKLKSIKVKGKKDKVKIYSPKLVDLTWRKTTTLRGNVNEETFFERKNESTLCLKMLETLQKKKKGNVIVFEGSNSNYFVHV